MSDERRESIVGAFIAWTLCGVLWFYSYLAALSVGGVVLIFAVLLTVLLGTKSTAHRFKVGVWVAFAAWLAWWALVVAGPAEGSAGWMLWAGIAFALLALGGGIGALGLPFGTGVLAFVTFTWTLDRESFDNPAVWAGVGLAVAGLSLALWLAYGLRARLVATDGS